MQRNPNRPAARRLNIDIGELRKTGGCDFWKANLAASIGRAQTCWSGRADNRAQKIGRTLPGTFR
jgi:hypothetical protein